MFNYRKIYRPKSTIYNEPEVSADNETRTSGTFDLKSAGTSLERKLVVAHKRHDPPRGFKAVRDVGKHKGDESRA